MSAGRPTHPTSPVVPGRPSRGRSQPYPITRVDLEAFVTANDLGGIAPAAVRLGVSPTSLVRRIRKLEQRAAIVLVEGLPSDVRLTDLGRRFLPTARRTVEELRAIDAFVEEHGDPDLAVAARYRPR